MTIAERNKKLTIENKILKDKINVLEKAFEESKKTEYEYRLDMYEDVKKEWEENEKPDIIEKIEKEIREKIIKDLGYEKETLAKNENAIGKIADVLADLGYDFY